MALATHPLLEPKLNNRVLPVLHQCAVKASYRENFTLLTIKTLSEQVVVSNVSKNEFWIVEGRCESEKIFLTTMQRVQLFQVRAPVFLTHCVQHEVQM